MQTDFEKNSFHADAKRLGKITVDPGMESKLTSFLKKMTRGKSMAPSMVLMATAGGAYYLYKQKGAEKGPTKTKMPVAPLDPTKSDQKEMTKTPERTEKEVQGILESIK